MHTFQLENLKLKEENEKLKVLGINFFKCFFLQIIIQLWIIIDINLIIKLILILVKTKRNINSNPDSLIDQEVSNNQYSKNLTRNDSKTERKSMQIRNIDKFVSNIDSKASQQLHTSVFSSDKILTKSKRVKI